LNAAFAFVVVAWNAGNVPGCAAPSSLASVAPGSPTVISLPKTEMDNLPEPLKAIFIHGQELAATKGDWRIEIGGALDMPRGVIVYNWVTRNDQGNWVSVAENSSTQLAFAITDCDFISIVDDDTGLSYEIRRHDPAAQAVTLLKLYSGVSSVYRLIVMLFYMWKCGKLSIDANALVPPQTSGGSGGGQPNNNVDLPEPFVEEDEPDGTQDGANTGTNSPDNGVNGGQNCTNDKCGCVSTPSSDDGNSRNRIFLAIGAIGGFFLGRILK